MKTFTIAGSSKLNGKIKNRFANGTIKHRTQVLSRNGHTEIERVELPRAMTKDEAVAFLEAQTIMAPSQAEVEAEMLDSVKEFEDAPL